MKSQSTVYHRKVWSSMSSLPRNLQDAKNYLLSITLSNDLNKTRTFVIQKKKQAF